MNSEFKITANVVDPFAGNIKAATVYVEHGVIRSIEPATSGTASHFLMPGFVDSHIHVESSMLLPSQFARTATVHGTVATVSDPHEIANVCGVDGVELMLRNAAQVNFKFCFGAPACVPATRFETSGARIDSAGVAKLLDDPRIGYLSEVMDYPGVLSGVPEVLAKIKAAEERDKPVDGHAPGLRGEQAKKYISTGITTDHECVALEEAIDKINAGCKIAIREGSAARNFDALKSLIDTHNQFTMLCSDDKHPDELLLGHINQLAARAMDSGCDLFNVIRAACVNPVQHYGLNIGLLQTGEPADFILVEDLDRFNVLETYIDGHLVAKHGKTLLPDVQGDVLNQFAATPIQESDLKVVAKSDRIRVIEAIEGQLITKGVIENANVVDGEAVQNPAKDLLKLVVLNRYEAAKPSLAFVRGFGIKHGAFASSVAHDSHNIVAVGANDSDLCAAINEVIKTQGGLCVAEGATNEILPLPVAGLMSTESCDVVGAKYSKLDRIAKELGCPLRAPFMTLSFLALLVIPALKLSDQGLFDVERFEFVELFV